MKIKHYDISDSQLFNLFRGFCASDEDCEKAVKDAKEAFAILNSDKVFRK